jgi:hypothetical protein
VGLFFLVFIPRLPVTSDEHRSWSHLIVRETLYSTRENVNLVHEVFRQAFLLSPAHSAAVRVVVSIYRDWITRFVS